MSVIIGICTIIWQQFVVEKWRDQKLKVEGESNYVYINQTDY